MTNLLREGTEDNRLVILNERIHYFICPPIPFREYERRTVRDTTSGSALTSKYIAEICVYSFNDPKLRNVLLKGVVFGKKYLVRVETLSQMKDVTTKAFTAALTSAITKWSRIDDILKAVEND